jgi:hypothetical protein
MPVAADHNVIIALMCDSRSVIGCDAKPPPGEISILIDEPLVPGHASEQYALPDVPGGMNDQ